MAVTTLRGSTFVRNIGTSAEQVLSQASTPFPDFRIEESGGLPLLIRNFRLLVSAVRECTLAARSLPFGGPTVYVLDCSFTNAVNLKIPHRLKTSRVRVWLGQPTIVLSGTPLVTWSVDDTFATLTPQGTFTADVLFLVAP